MPRPPQYTHTSLLAFRTALATRLQDPAYVYWGASELNGYIVGALRTWQALTTSYRDSSTFDTVAGTAFYDLTEVSTDQYGYTVTDTQLVTELQYLLLEPVGIPWTGSNQFTLGQLTGAVQKRRDQFLSDSGMVVSLLPLPFIPSPNAGRIQLAGNILAVRRAAWVTPAGFYTPLYRTDEFGATNFSGLTTTPGLPFSYSVSTSPPASLNIYPPPLTSGGVSLCAIQAGPSLNPATGVLLGVPDDFAEYIKFGALADLLNADGQCRDPQRAAYAETRYQEGVTVAQLFPGGLQMYVNQQPIRVGSTSDFDGFNRGWQNSSGKPTRCGFTGRNLLALNTVPDAVYSVSLAGVRNMPVPVTDADYIQVGLDSLDAVLSYAQHLASFKMGGQEFQNTQAQYQIFITAAGRVNLKLKAEAFYSIALTQPASLQGFRVPMETAS